MFRNFTAFLFLVAGALFVVGGAFPLLAPRPPVVAVAPQVRPYDVTIYIPGQGPRTVVVHSSKFEFKEGCFISYAPKFTIECQVLEVMLCTENCNPSGAPSEEVFPEVSPSALVARS